MTLYSCSGITHSDKIEIWIEWEDEREKNSNNIVMFDGSRRMPAAGGAAILDIDPSNVDMRVDMGTCYRRIGKSERAVEEFRKALEYNPDHLFGHMNLGIVLANDFGNYSEAIKEFEKYLEIAPNAQNARVIRNEIQNLKAASRTSR